MQFLFNALNHLKKYRFHIHVDIGFIDIVFFGAFEVQLIHCSLGDVAVIWNVQIWNPTWGIYILSIQMPWNEYHMVDGK